MNCELRRKQTKNILFQLLYNLQKHKKINVILAELNANDFNFILIHISVCIPYCISKSKYSFFYISFCVKNFFLINFNFNLNHSKRLDVKFCTPFC